MAIVKTMFYELSFQLIQPILSVARWPSTKCLTPLKRLYSQDDAPPSFIKQMPTVAKGIATSARLSHSPLRTSCSTLSTKTQISSITSMTRSAAVCMTRSPSVQYLHRCRHQIQTRSCY